MKPSNALTKRSANRTVLPRNSLGYADVAVLQLANKHSQLVAAEASRAQLQQEVQSLQLRLREEAALRSRVNAAVSSQPPTARKCTNCAVLVCTIDTIQSQMATCAAVAATEHAQQEARWHAAEAKTTSTTAQLVAVRQRCQLLSEEASAAKSELNQTKQRLSMQIDQSAEWEQRALCGEAASVELQRYERRVAECEQQLAEEKHTRRQVQQQQHSSDRKASEMTLRSIEMEAASEVCSFGQLLKQEPLGESLRDTVHVLSSVTSLSQY